MDLFGMYADSDDEEELEEEQEGQSLPAAGVAPLESSPGAAQTDVSCEADQASRLIGVDGDMISVGGPPGPPGTVEEERVLPPNPLEWLPQDLRELPPGDPIPGISANVRSWLGLKDSGTHMAAALRQSRDFCNPYMMSMMIEYNQLDEYGSCYPKDMWDPKGIPAEDFSRPLERELKIQQRRLEQEQRSRNKVEFTSPGSDTSKTAAAVAAAAAAVAVAGGGGGALPMAATQVSSMSAVAAATLAKAKAAAASISAQAQAQQGQQLTKSRRASKWDANPLMK